MESLSSETWDVVIAGTGLRQSLLALALSRSNKKILHVDRNLYYGGPDAGISLNEAKAWSETAFADTDDVFSDVLVDEYGTATSDEDAHVLAPARSYTLSLNPQIIYAQSMFLPSLVSSQVHNQLEFLAVGSWWIHQSGTLHKIPSTREDVFNDEDLSMRNKRSLMKFLRYVLQEDTSELDDAQTDDTLLSATLREKFNIDELLHYPLLALSLSPLSAGKTSFTEAVKAIRRHVRSVGYFGPGFGAVVAKYGGTAEIAQVACRAQAVGGGVYLLGHGISNLDNSHSGEASPSSPLTHDNGLVHVVLTDGTKVKSRHLVGSRFDIPRSVLKTNEASTAEVNETLHSVDIVSDQLKDLFPVISENGPVPAVAMVLIDDESGPEEAPIYLQIHSEDTGECPSGQCIIYGSVQISPDASRRRLRNAVQSFIRSCSQKRQIQSLWHMSYVSRHGRPDTNNSQPYKSDRSDQIHVMPTRSYKIALDDKVLDDVKSIWEVIVGDDAQDQTFLRFEDREQILDM